MTEETTTPKINGQASAPESVETVIETKELWRVYKSAAQEVQALRGVNLQIGKGHYVALVGRSGSGKTTLLNIVGGLDQATSGEVCIFGRNLSQMNERKRTRWRRKEVGFVFQSFGLLPTLSAYENVELMPRIAGMKARQRKARALYCLELVGLKKWMHHRPYEMSGGQQQRVAIARALANQPKLILADEPTGELDSATAREILSLFQHIVAEEGVTILMVSHDNLVYDYVDQVLRLRDGEIVPEN
jgi:ABC-type lipoprotein export system ATPase subunit